MAGSVGGSGDEPEFQVAPMIDVLLVLLIFFMSITSAQVLQLDKKLTLPVSPSAKKPPPDEKKHQEALNVRFDTTEQKTVISLGANRIDDREQLVNALRDRKTADKDIKIIIRGDKTLKAIDIQRALDYIAQAGIDNVGFAATNKE